jgi:class III poly(R)-hydroxyalkanoic acid synthase PhaE subunit
MSPARPSASSFEFDSPSDGVPLQADRLSRLGRAVATAAWEAPWTLHERTSARLLRMPGIGLTREVQEKSTRAVDAWLNLMRASGPYAVLLGDAGLRSVPAVARRLAALAVARRRLDGQAMVEAALEAVEDALHVTLESQEYFQAQANLVNAAMIYRSRQRELSNLLLRFSDFASRDDVEGVGRTVQALRRQVRLLRREVEALAAVAVPVKGAAPADSAARRPREVVGA